VHNRSPPQLSRTRARDLQTMRRAASPRWGRNYQQNYKQSHSCKAYTSSGQGGLFRDGHLPQVVENLYSFLRGGLGAFIIAAHVAAPVLHERQRAASACGCELEACPRPWRIGARARRGKIPPITVLTEALGRRHTAWVMPDSTVRWQGSHHMARALCPVPRAFKPTLSKYLERHACDRCYVKREE
jgi:hypothetical protein